VNGITYSIVDVFRVWSIFEHAVLVGIFDGGGLASVEDIKYHLPLGVLALVKSFDFLPV
jgi:hypothetical protein